MDSISTRKRSSPAPYDVADDDSLYETRMPSSVRRYRSSHTMDDPTTQRGTFIQRRASRVSSGLQHQGTLSKAVAPSDAGKHTRSGLARLPRRHPLATLIVGGVLAILLVMLASMLTSWWQNYQDTIHYGYPRTSHLDAQVGHKDDANHPTHFIFLNLHCNIQIIEIQGGDPARTRIFNGPTLYGPGCDTVPVWGEIKTEQGKRNLIVHIQDQQIEFVNDGQTFQMH